MLTATADDDLVGLARDGDQRAFDSLMVRYGGRLRAYCAAFHANPADRDELAQLVMIRVWRGIAGFDQRACLTTWLYRIVANTAATEYRKGGRLPTPVDDPAVLAGGGDFRSPDDIAVLRSTVDSALAELSPNFRTVVELVDRYGFSPADVARLCDIPEPTVRTRLWRARGQLRTALAAHVN